MFDEALNNVSPQKEKLSKLTYTIFSLLDINASTK
jgi:hypothetical protein